MRRGSLGIGLRAGMRTGLLLVGGNSQQDESLPDEGAVELRELLKDPSPQHRCPLCHTQRPRLNLEGREGGGGGRERNNYKSGQKVVAVKGCTHVIHTITREQYTSTLYVGMPRVIL